MIINDKTISERETYSVSLHWQNLFQFGFTDKFQIGSHFFGNLVGVIIHVAQCGTAWTIHVAQCRTGRFSVTARLIPAHMAMNVTLLI